MIQFDSLNPYGNLEVIIADDPQSLVLLIKAIRMPIKIVQIVQYGTRQAAYVMGDIGLKPNVKKSKTLKG